uniref:Uncharacterized protein n=1 Tax=viral metagenome TaxID=1070528 RepID=A0A6M3J662_9ZZZZ
MVEHYRCIIGRYKEEPQDRVDVFVTAISWFTIGLFAGMIVAGIITGFH